MPRKLDEATAQWARELWDQALEAPKGLRVRYATKAQATIARFALYDARRADAELSKSILQTDDPEYGKSAYRVFRVTLEPKEDGQCDLLITRHIDPRVTALKIEAF